MSTNIKVKDTPFKPRRGPGDIVFAVVAVAFALFLLSRLGSETTWLKGISLGTQPRFWPAVSIFGMVFFGLIYFIGSLRHLANQEGSVGKEILFWLRGLEFTIWFMVYVFMTPVIGYLFASILFCVVLAARVGYRSLRSLMISAGLSVAIVLLFKTFLQVRIPGGTIYEYLPDGFRNFMILYF
jgi:hypothetical protein